MAQEVVTISISSDVAEALRRRADAEGCSFSDVVEEALREGLTGGDDSSTSTADAHQTSGRLRELMSEGLPLALGARVPWTREELHERS